MSARGLVSVVLVAGGCASVPAWKVAPHDQRVQTVPPRAPAPCPQVSADLSAWWLALSRGAIEPLADALSPGTWLLEHEALDVNAFGQVVGSGWFTPRLGSRPLLEAEVVDGHAQSPPIAGPLRVMGAKLEGVTPGLVVEDSSGARFFAKFDPPALPGMSSGAELIASRVLHAAGWNVPETYIGELGLDDLVLSPDATTRGEYGATVPLTRIGLESLIANVNPNARGVCRALFSRVLPGRAVGHDSFAAPRPHDDSALWPTDRRSLRALGVFYAWLGNTDARDSNTLATWSPEPGTPELGHITHYLLDFGDSLGAAGSRAKFQSEGYEYRVDWAGIGSQLFSLGFYYHRWLPVRRAPMRAVGFFESEVFDPERWRPGLPNPAFDASTPLDRYWAASILARFTPQLLAGIVARAGYTERGAEAYVVQTLRERQEKLMRWAFAPVLPLDDPEIVGGTELRLLDLAVESGVLDRRGVGWRVTWGDGDVLATGEISDTRALRIALASALPSSDRLAKDPFLSVHVFDVERPQVEVRVHLRVVDGALLPVALERDVD